MGFDSREHRRAAVNGALLQGFWFLLSWLLIFLLKWFSSLFYDDLEVYGLECTCGFGVPS